MLQYWQTNNIENFGPSFQASKLILASTPYFQHQSDNKLYEKIYDIINQILTVESWYIANAKTAVLVAN